MFEIRKLNSIYENDIKNMGFNGFKTDKVYKVTRNESEKNLLIELKLEQLSEQYIKEWSNNPESIIFFEEVIKQGLSIGVYDSNTLIGFALVSYYAWNNSIWIENIRVSEKYRGKGVGKKIIKEIVEIASNKKARIVGLETQGTNYPAIQFYKKCSFEISGIDFSRYPQKENDKEQVAVLMSKTIIG